VPVVHVDHPRDRRRASAYHPSSQLRCGHQGAGGAISRAGQSRGWRNARLLSSAPSTYNLDYLAEDADGSQWPLATVFFRRTGRIHHFWNSELWLAQEEGQDPRHVDFMWPMWLVFDRAPEGRGDFFPALEYS
jgi:predicted dithiol-disulfide oxidoreductase (DUF899 family)